MYQGLASLLVLLVSLQAFADVTKIACRHLFSDGEISYFEVGESLTTKEDFVMMSANLEHFRVLRPFPEDPSFVEPTKNNSNRDKPEHQVAQIQRALDTIQPDVAVFVELVGKYSSHILDAKKQYTHHTETPNTNGVHLGFLVKKSLNADVQLVVPEVGAAVANYRGLPYIMLRERNAEGKVNRGEEPFLIVIGAHLRAFRNEYGEQAFNRIKEAEVQEVDKLVSQLEGRYPSAKITVMGDMNADMNIRPEMFRLKGRMQDTLDYTADPTARESRASHTYHGAAKLEAAQLDAHLVNYNLFNHLKESYIYRDRDVNGNAKLYMDKNGQTFLYPTTQQQRSENPSDHSFVVSHYNMLRGTALVPLTLQPFHLKLRSLYAEINSKMAEGWAQNDLLIFDIQVQGDRALFQRWLTVNKVTSYVDVITNGPNGTQIQASFQGLGYLLLRDSINTEPWIQNLKFLAPAGAKATSKNGPKRQRKLH